MSASDLRRHLESALDAPAVCQGVCGRQFRVRDLQDSGGFDVCAECLASSAWAEELRRRQEARMPPGPTNFMGRPTVKG